MFSYFVSFMSLVPRDTSLSFVNERFWCSAVILLEMDKTSRTNIKIGFGPKGFYFLNIPSIRRKIILKKLSIQKWNVGGSHIKCWYKLNKGNTRLLLVNEKGRDGLDTFYKNVNQNSIRNIFFSIKLHLILSTIAKSPKIF